MQYFLVCTAGSENLDMPHQISRISHFHNDGIVLLLRKNSRTLKFDKMQMRQSTRNRSLQTLGNESGEKIWRVHKWNQQESDRRQKHFEKREKTQKKSRNACHSALDATNPFHFANCTFQYEIGGKPIFAGLHRPPEQEGKRRTQQNYRRDAFIHKAKERDSLGAKRRDRRMSKERREYGRAGLGGGVTRARDRTQHRPSANRRERQLIFYNLWKPSHNSCSWLLLEWFLYGSPGVLQEKRFNAKMSRTGGT